ncbi:endonuclease III [Candidatus Gracilibacteria bacterium]|nr:endonuclease III [Candidatus Gracilibacteria bacterium]
MKRRKKDWGKILEPIIIEYGGKKIELDYETHFQLLCAVILSAQTTDKQVNRITPPFFALVREARDVIDIPLEHIEEHLRYVNFFRNKSRFIRETGTILAEKYNGIIPDDLDLIQTFPGIGIKTAKVVLAVLYNRPYVGVDTHIHRVMNRLGVVDTTTPNQTDREIDHLFDIETKRLLHHPLVLFGRYHCTARKPKCESCKLQKECKYYREKSSKSKK